VSVGDLNDAVHDDSVYRALFEGFPGSLMVIDEHGIIVLANKELERVFGYPRTELVGRHLSVILPDALGDDSEAHDAQWGRDVACVGRRCDNAELALEIRMSALSACPAALVSVSMRNSLQDPLTGLANRALFYERLDSTLARRPPRGVDVLLVDLDDFKEVNDVFGHRAGDDLLVEVGRRLERCVQVGDTVARLGGDEFGILLTGDRDPLSTAVSIVAALNMPAAVHGAEGAVSASLGISTTPDCSLNGPELLRRADIALYEAKAAGKNRHQSFHPDMMTALLARTDLDAGLRRAVGRHEIVVHFQPIVSPLHVAVSQVEVLVRWERPSGLLAPLSFIPAAERNGSIIEIGDEVLRQACTQLSGWINASDFRSIAVNVSAVQLGEEHFASRVLTILAAGEVPPCQVVVEVTESVFSAEGDHVVGQLSALRDHGVRISIDDFGTGYSSLGRLQDLPVDAIKLDKSFVDKIVTGEEHLPILTSMIDMAHNLGLHVTAEGIESEVQATRLVRLGCDALQGYLFSRPQPASELPSGEERSTARIQEVLVQKS
jgi:diguanylate cyclase (GGDEF)-like protein